jgi:glycine oxidase
VAGAGVTGLAIAVALADDGWSVTVCDPAAPTANASGVAAGMLAPAFEAALDRPDHYPLLHAARDRWPDFAQACGIALDRSGAVAQGPEAWLGEVAAFLARCGADHERRADGVFTPEDWRLDPPQALAAVSARAADLGVRRLDQRVNAFRSGEVVLSGRETLRADRLVVATGAAGGLAPEQAGLIPIKGHILRFPTVLAGGPVVRGQGVYLCPSQAGLVVGATMEEGRSDLAVDSRVAAELAQAGAGLRAELAGRPYLIQTGIRAATLDGLPLVGASSADGVILAVGLRRNGWLLAPLVAEQVRRTLAGEDSLSSAAKLDPARLAVQQK